jgi:hypothetical protein
MHHVRLDWSSTPVPAGILWFFILDGQAVLPIARLDGLFYRSALTRFAFSTGKMVKTEIVTK